MAQIIVGRQLVCARLQICRALQIFSAPFPSGFLLFLLFTIVEKL